jgi:hypothetical protein
MSNKKVEAVQDEVLTPQEATTEQSVAQVNQNFDIEAMLEKSAQLDKLDTVVSLSPESITLEKVGESFRGIFMGFGEMTINDQNNDEGKRTISCAKFLIDKKMRINGGAVLVSEIKNAAVKEGTPLLVEYTEKKGNVKIYRISLLG